MPLTHFDCKVGKIPIKDCFNSCPAGDRCLSLPTLHAVGEQRIMKPPYHFSTTFLQQGTRQAYLSIVNDYSIHPQDRAFMLLGTRHHQHLDIVAKKLEELKSELYMKGDINSILDLLEPINGGNDWEMIDYKCVGCYSVAKMLDKKPDFSGYDIQLNDYRIKAQKLGFNIKKLSIQYTARDFGVTTTAKYKITEPMGKVSVPFIPDDEIIEYFFDKDTALRHSLEFNILPPPCTHKETWGGRKCQKYCDVSIFCEQGQKLVRLNND